MELEGSAPSLPWPETLRGTDGAVPSTRCSQLGSLNTYAGSGNLDSLVRAEYGSAVLNDVSSPKFGATQAGNTAVQTGHVRTAGIAEVPVAGGIEKRCAKFLIFPFLLPNAPLDIADESSRTEQEMAKRPNAIYTS